MARNKLAVLFLLIVFSLLIVSAQDNSKFYSENGQNLTIRDKCIIDGSICDSSYTCNISIITPQQTLLIDNKEMTNDGFYYSYDLNKSQTILNGVYETTIDCKNTTSSTSNYFTYSITPSGSSPIDSSQALILFIGILILFIFSIFLAWLSNKIDHAIVSLMLLSFSIMIMVFSVGMILNIVELSFGTFEGIVNNFSTAYIVFMILASVGIFGLVVWLVVISLNLYWNNRGLQGTMKPLEK